MPLDAIDEILAEENITRSQIGKGKRFTFEWLAGKIIERQKHGKDCIIIIIGDRRTGKSNWGLKLIRAYIKLRRQEDPAFKWSWADNFPLTRTAAMRKASELPPRSFIFLDEGGDQFYTQETMKRAQRELIKFMNKSGSRLHLTIIIWPDPFTLDQKIISMAQFLVIVAYRYQEVCSFAFIYGKSGNPLTYDAFGIMRIRRRLESPTKTRTRSQLPTMDGRIRVIHKKKELVIPYPRNLFKFLRSIPSFVKSHRYGPVDARFEKAYINNVKDKLLENRDDDNYVNIVVHNKLKNQYETLLYNLYVRNDMSYAQIERLHISPVDGQHLKSLSSIRSSINTIKAQA